MKNKKNSSKRRILSPSRLIILIILIAGNTFAWFIYATKIDNTVSVHVKGWNVTFEANENEVTNQVSVNVENVYPGMEDYEYNITAYNNSEVTANFTYQILEARILNTSYTTVEGRQAAGETVLATDPTSAELEQMLAEDFPFVITLGTTGSVLDTNNDSEDFSLTVEWDYESNQDALDTQWGIAAHDYKTAHPNDSSISFLVKLILTQNAN